MTNQQIANTILAQLGGNKFIAMTGAFHLLAITQGLSLKFKGNKKANYMTVELQADDTYTVIFKHLKTINYMPVVKDVASFERVYAEQLQDIFTQITGLATHL